MRQILTPARRKVAHDYDGVHYDYAAMGDVYAFLGQVKLSLAEMLFPDLLAELGAAKIIEIGKASYHRTGDGLYDFVEMVHARDPDRNREELQREVHVLYNQINMRRTLSDFPDVFSECAATNASLSRIGGHLHHGLATQSCLENWAVPGLKRQNRFHHFDPDALIGFAEGGFQTKSMSTEPLRRLLDKMKAQPEEVIFLEDSLENLRMAKTLDARILTVHICHDTPSAVLPDFVDIQVPKLHTFLHQVESVCGIKTPDSRMTLEMR